MTKLQEYYTCGHIAKTIIMDSNHLSMSAYFEWKDTVGFDGDKTQCWNCFCKQSSQKKELKNDK